MTQEKTVYPYHGVFTFGTATISSKGKEYFTGYFQVEDEQGGKQSYKCTCFRSSMVGIAKHLGAVGDNKAAMKNLKCTIYSEKGFELNSRSNKYEIIFERVDLLDPGYKEISDWFNNPANFQQS